MAIKITFSNKRRIVMIVRSTDDHYINKVVNVQLYVNVKG